MTTFALTGARVFTGEDFLDDAAVLIEAGRIVDIVAAGAAPAGARRLDLAGGVLAPGFVDAQVNGGGGVLFNETPTLQGVAAIARAHARFGTTALLPTCVTDRPEITRAAVAAVREAIAHGVPGVAGVHLEGPHIAPSRHGAHETALIRPLLEADAEMLTTTGLATCLVTLARESASLERIAQLAAAGVIVSLGHSDASYDVARAAYAAGARGATHLFNAMSQLTNREPGMVGAALDTGEVWAGVIADGIHVHPASLAAAIRAKRGPGRLFLVTDAMPPAGSPVREFQLNGRRVLRSGGALRLEDGTLAGADLTMDSAVRYVAQTLGLGLAEALRMASLYPAQFLGLDVETQGRGRIAAGRRADLVWLDDALAVRGVWIGGESTSL